MTSPVHVLTDDSVSPYLRMTLREAPKPHTKTPQMPSPVTAPVVAPNGVVDATEPPSQRSEVPPFARPGIKL